MARPRSTSPPPWPAPASSIAIPSGCSARRSRRSTWPRIARRSATSSTGSTSRTRRASSSRATTPAEREAATQEALDTIGLPAIVRPAYTLGGTGGGIVETEAAYREIVRTGLRSSPIGQVMVEKCLVGWQEIEYEVMRDADDTCIAVCSMENVDPLGIHTGDSIVVAPGPDPDRCRPPAPPQRGPRDHPGARRRGRLQRPVRALAGLDRVRRHRGQPAGQPLLRARLQGHGLPDRPGRGADRGRAAARRDPERRDRHDRGRLRAGARLRRRQAAALPVRQVPDGRPHARQPDEGHGRGDGHRPDVRLGAQQGAPGSRAGRRRAARRGPELDRDVRLPRRRLRGRPGRGRADPLDRRAGPGVRVDPPRPADRRAPRPPPLPRAVRLAVVAAARPAAARRPGGGRRGRDRHLGLVPRRDGPERGARTGRGDDRPPPRGRDRRRGR